MIGLPRSTEFNTRIPKEKFYENLNVTPALKKCFIEQIKIIFWRNKIAATTTNLASGTSVTEIEVPKLIWFLFTVICLVNAIGNIVNYKRIKNSNTKRSEE